MFSLNYISINKCTVILNILAKYFVNFSHKEQHENNCNADDELSNANAHKLDTDK